MHAAIRARSSDQAVRELEQPKETACRGVLADGLGLLALPLRNPVRAPPGSTICDLLGRRLHKAFIAPFRPGVGLRLLRKAESYIWRCLLSTFDEHARSR